MQTKVKSVTDILVLLGQQLDQLRPTNKPTQTSFQAAKATATVVNSYLGTIRLGMEYAKMQGRQPNLQFLGMPMVQDSKPTNERKQ